MFKTARTLSVLLMACSSMNAIAQSETKPAESRVRPPATPLIANDPYFSVWSMTDTLNGSPTRHWTGRPQPIRSVVSVDGQKYRVIGTEVADDKAAKQTGLTVTPTKSEYTFEAGPTRVTVTFLTPLLPDDLLVMSRPITYVTWMAESTDGQEHNVDVMVEIESNIARNRDDQKVETQTGKAGELNTIRVGTVDQPVLETRGDDLRIDFGYFYLAGKSSAMEADKDQTLKATFPIGKVSAQAVSTHAILAYDDVESVQYFNERLKGYWTKDGATIDTLIATAEKEYESLVKRCEEFDREMIADLKLIGGDSFVQLGVLAYRQSLAAQKIVADPKGMPLSFSKENNSNGCMATVDVLYPASPLMMAFSPNLLKASLVPLLDYSSSPRWKHNSAPHDIGTYPIATGQVYGGGDSDSGMPVEETGNMLCMIAALAKIEGNAEFSKPYWPTLTKWANYLKTEGFDPGNQLTTDDFAGHIARNTNLSAKAIMGVASYAMLADMLGHKDVAAEHMKVAKEAAAEWTKKAADGDHYMLVFGDKGKDTWSQKYNIAWDTILGFNVFPPEVREKEIAFYKTKMNKFGLPLDSRKSYTKLDWELWTATLADKHEDFQQIVDACAKFANETESRVPMTDWYDTKSGKQSGFKARSVVGGVFIPLLKDEAIWKKYASRDKTKLTSWAQTDFSAPKTKTLVAAADTEPAEWMYTTTKPSGDAWTKPDFDAKNWKTGKSGFGVANTPGSKVGTRWNGREIWLRREIELASKPSDDVRLWVHHDEDVEVYINGVLAYKKGGFTSEYIVDKLRNDGKAALKQGKNVIAVRCEQHTGGQYIDVGLVELEKPSK